MQIRYISSLYILITLLKLELKCKCFSSNGLTDVIHGSSYIIICLIWHCFNQMLKALMSIARQISVEAYM